MKNKLVAFLENLIRLLNQNKNKKNINKAVLTGDKLKAAEGGLDCLDPKSAKCFTGIFC